MQSNIRKVKHEHTKLIINSDKYPIALIYLRQSIEVSKENQTAKISCRIRLGWVAFGKLSHVPKSRKIPLTRQKTCKLNKGHRAMKVSILVKAFRNKAECMAQSKNKRNRSGQTGSKIEWRWAGNNTRQEDKRQNRLLQFSTYMTVDEKGVDLEKNNSNVVSDSTFSCIIFAFRCYRY